MRRIILGLGILGVLAGGAGLPGAETGGDGPVTHPSIVGLTAQSDDQGVTVLLEASAPVTRFSCRMEPGRGRAMTLELPGATVGRGDTAAVKSTFITGVTIHDGVQGAPGVAVRFDLKDVSLVSVAGTGSGLTLRLTRDASDQPAAAGAEYRVGTGDKLEIGILEHPDMGKIVEVRGDGSINYPLIGDLSVAGKSVSEIEAEITAILAKDYLVDPQVSVDVREYQSQWVTILGEVRTPGRYVLKRDMRLIDLLAEAGGATKEAGPTIFVTRRVDSESGPQQLEVDLGRLFGGDNQASNIALKHGDIVSLEEKKIFYIRGEVVKPGAYPLLVSDLTLLKAISLAGGFGPFANTKSVEILRGGETGKAGKKIVVSVKAIEDGRTEDVRLQPNDVINVPRRIF